MKLEKKVKKQSQLVNLLNLQPMSWDGDNLIKKNTMLKDLWLGPWNQNNLLTKNKK
jgi:hypothetical protein